MERKINEWKEKVIEKITETDPLYLLTLYFQDEQSEEILRFKTTNAQLQLKRLGIVYPNDYKLLLTDVFNKTLNSQFGFDTRVTNDK